MANKDDLQSSQQNEFVNVVCPNCGTPLKINVAWKHVRCKHCGQVFYMNEVLQKQRNSALSESKIDEEVQKMDDKTATAIEKFKSGKFQKALLILGVVFALLTAVFFKRKAILPGIISLFQALLAFASWMMGSGRIKTPKYGWHKLLVCVIFVLMIPCITALGRSEKDISVQKDQDESSNSSQLSGQIVEQSKKTETSVSQGNSVKETVNSQAESAYIEASDSKTEEFSIEESDPAAMLTVQNVVGKTLPEALELLQTTGFTNIRTDADSDPQWDDNRWIITEQSVAEGTSLLPDEEIKLSCVKLCQVYIDAKSELNAIFSTYAMDIYMDDTLIGTVENGKYLTQLIDITEGAHELFAYRSDNNSMVGSKKLTITNDTTIQCEISHSSTSITFKSWNLANGVSASSIEVPALVGMVLSTAKDQLENAGFVNVHYESSGDNSIWNTNNWTVISQNVEPGAIVDKNEEILLTCQKTEDYVLSLFKNLTIEEAEQKAKEENLKITCESILTGETIDATGLDTDHKQRWAVEEASMKASEDKLIVLRLRFTGEVEVPDVIKLPLDEADSALKSLQMSHVSLQDESGKNISAGNSWIVLKQSINEGTVVQADKEIILTCTKYKDLFSEQLVGLTMLEANEKTAEYEYATACIRHESSSDNVNEDDLTEEEKQFWVVTKLQDINTNKKTVTLNIEYTGDVEVPDLAGMKLDAALKLLESRYFENIVAKYDDKAIPGYSDYSGYMVETQSVDPETTINAQAEIVLTCSKLELPVYYSTNGASTVSNGNTGKYAYKSRGGTYDVYWIIDFDEGYVYNFYDNGTSGDMDEYKEGYRDKIDSGTLNDAVVLVYHDSEGEYVWKLFFKVENHPDHLIVRDHNGFLLEFYPTDLDKAMELRDKKSLKSTDEYMGG